MVPTVLGQMQTLTGPYLDDDQLHGMIPGARAQMQSLLKPELAITLLSGMIPVVGLPLPFFTKGGSSLLCFSIMLGLIFTSRGFLK